MFTGYDTYAAYSLRAAHAVVDIFAGQARHAALFGQSGEARESRC